LWGHETPPNLYEIRACADGGADGGGEGDGGISTRSNEEEEEEEEEEEDGGRSPGRQQPKPLFPTAMDEDTPPELPKKGTSRR
jgi:hypothetical protein